MVETGCCPKCESRLKRVKVEYVEVEGVGSSYNGVNYVSPICCAVVGVSIDPLALKAEIVSEILRALDKG